MGVPGSEGYKLASFANLKALADNYSILRTCLEIRKNEIRALEWDIVLTSDAAKAYQGDRQAMRDFGERRAQALKFFKRPDPDYFNFGSWVHAMMDQVFVYDALSLYMCPKRGKGLGRGLLGSDLDCLWLLDGSTLRPMLGLHGETPEPPAPGYQQYIAGVPRADLATMVAGLDLAAHGLNERDVRAELRSDQLIYFPYLKRPDTPYGYPIVEQAIIPIMTGLRKQAYQLDYFTESSTPRVWISPGENGNGWTPNQIRELQDALNSVAGDIGWAFKINVLPPGSKVMPQKDIQIVDDSDNWIATEVAMAANISPMEIGLIPKVSATASPFAAREMAQASRSIHERISTKPTLSYVTSIFDMIIQVVCDQGDMRFTFSGMEETQDVAALTDVLIKQVQSGIKSIDEGRDELHLPPWGLPETSAPVVFTQMGPVPLGQAASDTVSQIRQALTGAHDSAQGHAAAEGLARRASASGQSPRKALPAGTSGQGRMNGPVTQRQARRGGSLAPAHATAEGAPGHSGGKPVPKYAEGPGPAGHPGQPGAGPVPKAALAELEALGRHLRKGMHVSEWVPVHIPGATMAIIADDLDSGLSAGYAIAQASAALGKASPQQSPQQRQAARQSRQQQQMARLASRYRALIAAAFAAAIAAAGLLIAAWIAGTLAVTAAVLALMIAAEIRKALLPVLTALWTEAFDEAVRDAGGDPADYSAELAAFLATEGENWAASIADTGSGDLLAAIRAAILAGDAEAIAGQLAEVLGTGDRAGQIAVSEVTRAWNAGGWAVARATGIAFKSWLTRNDDLVCPSCFSNQDQGQIPFDKAFKSGKLMPPNHPNCRCRLIYAVSAQPFTGKNVAMRREVGLNGEVVWTDAEANLDVPGGRIFQPHRSDGTEVVPGAMTGGEPPRWDGSDPVPMREHAPDADDDAAYGEASGIGSRPGTYWPAPYMDGYWPSPHGHGTGQAPSSSPGAANGRPPNPAGKRAKNAAAEFLKTAPKASPAAVRASMRANFPSSALRWVGKIEWRGPVDIPLEMIDTSSEDQWAASHEQAHVDQIAADMKADKHVNPVIGVVRPGHARIRMVDGRHRFRAAKQNGTTVRGYVGFVPGKALLDQAMDTYHQQRHSGSSPQNKSFTAGALGDGSAHGLVPLTVEGQKVTKESVRYRAATQPGKSCGTCSMFIAGGSCTLVAGAINPADVCDRWEPKASKSAGVHDESSLPSVPLGRPYCAGLVVRAADTGRVLMLQRLASENDDGAGLLEWPGGHADDGETLLAAAMREWREEVGLPVPPGQVTGHWESSNGVYAGFVLEIPSESAVDLGSRDNSSNPDGDGFCPVLWVGPSSLGGNRGVRQEVLTDLPLLQAALNGNVSAKSAETPTLEATPHLLGSEGLWHTPDRHVSHRQKLPNYIEHIAAALMRDQGMGESQAIATAINAVKRWARGDLHWGHGKVTPEVIGASQRALAEWEQLRASHA